jgi:hypothetical protein
VRFDICRSGLIFGLLLSGCASSGGFALFSLGPSPETPAPSAEAGSCPTPEACAAQLKKMVGDPNRDWIGRPQSSDDYANGTRLFAYRALHKKLTCKELKGALEDTKAAAALLQSPHHQRARALTTTVARELKSEQDRRCKPKI